MLSTHRRGSGDPTFRRAADGSIWRGIRTLRAPPACGSRPVRQAGVVDATAWGPGAAWVLDQLPRMLGADDDPTGFEPPGPLVDAWRRHGNWRLGATDLVMESLVPAVVERRSPARRPSPGSASRPPVRRAGAGTTSETTRRTAVAAADPERLRMVPSWEWWGCTSTSGARAPWSAPPRSPPRSSEPGRWDRWVRPAAAHAARIGVWTSAEIRSRALGDADSVSFGDYHVAANIGWVLTGEPVDDAELAVLFEPYAGHRHRVQRLVELAGMRRARHGARCPLEPTSPGASDDLRPRPPPTSAEVREQAEAHLRALVGRDDAVLREDQWTAIEALAVGRAAPWSCSAPAGASRRSTSSPPPAARPVRGRP